MNFLISLLEKLFPLVPVKSQWEVENEGGRWVPARDYFDLDDPSSKLWHRLHAVFRRDRNLVSFYRKREAYRKALRKTLTIQDYQSASPEELAMMSECMD